VRPHAEGVFFLDTWRVGILETLTELLRISEKEQLVLNIHPGIAIASVMLTPEEVSRIVMIRPWFAPDYLIFNHYDVSTSERSGEPIIAFPHYDGYKKIYSVFVDNIEINSLHQYIIEPHHIDHEAVLSISSVSTSNSEHEQTLIDNSIDTEWRTKETRNDSDYIELHFHHPVTYNIVRLIGSNHSEYSGQKRIAISRDGNQWWEPDIILSNHVDTVIDYYDFQYIRIENLQEHERYAWSVSRVEFGNIDIEELR
jgi:hypothetical protein